MIAKLTVKEIMTTNVFTISAEAPLEDAALIMRAHKVGSVPVVDGNNNLVGIITETDIFDALLHALGATGDYKRLTIECEDKPCTLGKIGEIFAQHGINIRSLVVFHPSEGSAQIVIRTESGDLEPLLAELRRQSFVTLVS